MSSSKNVGEKIASIRESKSIAVADLAERCGFTAELMGRIEKNEAIPSLGHLIKVARALGVRLGTFLDDQDQLGPVISRKGGLNQGSRFDDLNTHAHQNLSFFPLAGDKSGRHMEPFIVQIDPQSSTEFPQSSHEGEEFIYVLDGEVEITYGKELYRLSAGDSIYYDSIVDHNVHTANGSPARILAVVYAPF